MPTSPASTIVRPQFPVARARTVAQPQRTIRLMVIDGHEMFAQSLRSVLEREDDIEVMAIANSVAAGLAVASELPDVILMDYRLPDGDGISAAARIRHSYPSIRVVLLSSSDDPDALLRVIAAGCVGYLDKSRSIEDLIAAIRVTAAGHVVISATDLTKLATGARRDVGDLTRREREILHLIAEGLSNKVIANRLVLSVHTVRTHVQTVLSKIGAHSKLEALAVAKRRGLVA